MHILEMQAAYGRLRGDSLRLEPGLNLIYAPNESGKSTWCSFIRTMLYGLPTRQSGPLADKNRFAPWTGEAMQGRMDLETDGRRWTVLRDTRRASASACCRASLVSTWHSSMGYSMFSRAVSMGNRAKS